MSSIRFVVIAILLIVLGISTDMAMGLEIQPYWQKFVHDTIRVIQGGIIAGAVLAARVALAIRAAKEVSKKFADQLQEGFDEAVQEAAKQMTHHHHFIILREGQVDHEGSEP